MGSRFSYCSIPTSSVLLKENPYNVKLQTVPGLVSHAGSFHLKECLTDQLFRYD